MGEELIIAAGMLLVALATAFTFFLADLVGLILGHGWGHYSKRRARKAKKK